MNKSEKIKFYSNLLTGSGIACVIIALLLLLNYSQIRRNDPLESITMTTLLERLEEEPDNEELIQEIRNLDLMARKAFFNNQWQINTGALLLLIGGIVFGISLSVLTKLKSTIEIPEEEEKEAYLIRKLSQRGIQVGGATLILLALGASYFSVDHLQAFDTSSTQTDEDLVEEAEQIEVVDISTGPLEPEVTQETSIEDTLVEESSVEELEELPPEEEASTPASAAIVYPEIATIYSQHGSFRGPMGNGVSYKKEIPTEWNGAEGTHILWKVKLPKKGKNSPVIWKNQLFLAAADNSGQAVYCYNRHSGALLWQKAINNVPGSPSQVPKTTEDTGLSAATLTTNGLRVYAIFATGDIAALNPSGEILWAKNLGVPDNHYGHSSSLVSWKEKVFVQYDTNEGARVLALNGENGETIWETNRDVRVSWASPILAPIGDDFQLILSADPTVAAYDIHTGKELWSTNCMMGEVGPSPAFGEGLIFAANEYATLAAIRPGGSIVWEDNEYLPEVASPAVANGLLYIATSYGVLACYDAKTGEKQWEHEAYSGFYSSPVIADGKVYALDTDGVMHIFGNQREKTLIGEPELGEGAVTTPAFANGRIYIRGEEHLYCIGE